MLSTTLALDDLLKVTRVDKPGLIQKEAKRRLDSQNLVFRAKPKKVTEAEYWETYYNDPDVIYEWNNGYLEEKPVSDHDSYLMYVWFVVLLQHFLQVKPIANTTGLEMGFRLNLAHHSQIRRPDLGVVLNTNPVPLLGPDYTYQGVCDMCIEALSDSKKTEIERDTKIKFLAYQAAGVKEYYILYAKGEPMAFYRLNQQGVYMPIKPVKGDLIQCQVLPGFQFRIGDLFDRPSLKEMSCDPVYHTFVFPEFEAEQKAHQKTKQLLQKEVQRVLAAEVEVARLKALLANKDDSQA